MSNLVFKFGTVSLLGHRLLTLRIGAVFGVILVCGAVVLWFWPGLNRGLMYVSAPCCNHTNQVHHGFKAHEAQLRLVRNRTRKHTR